MFLRHISRDSVPQRLGWSSARLRVQDAIGARRWRSSEDEKAMRLPGRSRPRMVRPLQNGSHAWMGLAARFCSALPTREDW